MAAIDRRTIAAGTPAVALMERAGAQVYAAMLGRYATLAGKKVALVCGAGNNGGDGFVVARLLQEAGGQPRVFLVSASDRLRGDAAVHADRMRAAGVPVVELADAGGGLLTRALQEADLVVDAVLGTGLTGPPREPAAGVLEELARALVPVVAVDLPSGIVADTGAVPGPCARAALTVTFGLPKYGHLFYPGRGYCGTLHVTDIGLDPDAIATCDSRVRMIDAHTAAGLLPHRPGDAHKGTCGTVVLLAGSVGMSGAAALSADAALYGGAGKVLVGVPASLNDILEVKLTEAMTRPLPELRRQRCLARRGLGEIRLLCEQADVVAVGPGLGRHRETMELVRRLVGSIRLPMVLDADALFALTGVGELLCQREGTTVLTPHRGEFARLAGLSATAISEDPVGHARAFATGHGVVLVLKGAPTLVAFADGEVLVNATGNPGMATAGAGDVLTGLIAALMAQGVAVEAAVPAAVRLHGSAGDRARDDLGEWGVTAGAIGAAIPGAMVQLGQTAVERDAR